jgi:hypothetical protein
MSIHSKRFNHPIDLKIRTEKGITSLRFAILNEQTVRIKISERRREETNGYPD